METAAYSLGLGCVILGSLLNNIPRPYRRAESAGIHVSGAGSGHRQARSEPDRQAAHAAHDAVLREHLPRLTPMAYSTSCPPSTRKFTGTTICAKPTVRWTPSAIRSPRSASRMSAIRHCSTRPPLRASVWISKTRTNEIGSDGLVTESSQSQHCDDSVPTPQHFITGYRQNCTTIPPVSHHQQTSTYQSHYADNQRPVLQENPQNQQYPHQW